MARKYDRKTRRASVKKQKRHTERKATEEKRKKRRSKPAKTKAKASLKPKRTASQKRKASSKVTRPEAKAKPKPKQRLTKRELHEVRVKAAKKAARTRKRNQREDAKREKKIADYERAKQARLRGAPGARKRVREARAALREMVEDAAERSREDFQRRLDDVFRRRREEREAREKELAARRKREQEVERVTLTREERTEEIERLAREDLVALARKAKSMLPDADNRRTTFAGASGAKGERREAYIDLIIEPDTVDRIVRMVAEAADLLSGAHPFWMGTYWLTAKGNELVGSFKLRLDQVSNYEDRAGLRGELQAMMVNSTGVQRTKLAMLRQVRAHMEAYTTARFGRTDIYLHRVSVWNYTRSGVAQ